MFDKGVTDALVAVFLVLLVAAALFVAVVVIRSALRSRQYDAVPIDPTACTPWQRARQFLRRTSWFWLFGVGFALYPRLQGWITSLATHGLMGNEYYDQAASNLAKTVDWVQVYSKFSVAAGVFVFVNALAWGTLYLAIPVLPDWATGRYKTPQADYPVVPGFKGTFLRLSDVWRIGLFLLAFALEIYAANSAVEHAFRIQ